MTPVRLTELHDRAVALLPAAARRFALDQALPGMEDAYHARFSEEQIRAHGELLASIDEQHPCRVLARPAPDGCIRVTVVAADWPGELAILCGLLAAEGFNVLSASAFTSRPDLPAGTGRPDLPGASDSRSDDSRVEAALHPGDASGSGVIEISRYTSDTGMSESPAAPRRRSAEWWARRRASATGSRKLPARRIVDEFLVRRLDPFAPAPDWTAFEARLTDLSRKALESDWRAAREALIEPVCETLRRFSPSAAAAALLPVRIELDNQSLPGATVIGIESADTPAFLFQLLTAFAMRGIYVIRMDSDTGAGRAVNRLAVTDAKGRPLDIAGQGEELRAAAALIKQFSHLLPQSPNPPMALRNFAFWLDDMLARPGWHAELARLSRGDALHDLARLMGVSEFLWEDFLRLQHENLLPLLRHERPGGRRGLAELRDELQSVLAAVTLPDDDPNDPDTRPLRDDAERREAALLDARSAALNTWKDEQMFRIDMRHILAGSDGFVAFSAEMSDLAEAAVTGMADLLMADLLARHGRPRLPDGSPCRHCVAALGKTGGAEMGVASDIELMFLYEGDGTTDARPDRAPGSAPAHGGTADVPGLPRTSIDNARFFADLVNGVQNRFRARREGIFEIDLRLRPHGDSGPLAASVEAFSRYYGPEGTAPNLQRQALVRFRPIAGDPLFCREMVRLRDRVLYEGRPLDVANVLHLRRRQADELVPKGKVNAKFSPGGLVDIEYAVQAMQVKHGRNAPQVRSPNTLTALQGLRNLGKLADAKAEGVRKAWLFLRRLIDALRIVRGHAKDLCLPDRDSGEFAYLARRMDYPPDRPEDTARRLADDIRRVLETVQRFAAETYEREFPEAWVAHRARSAE